MRKIKRIVAFLDCIVIMFLIISDHNIEKVNAEIIRQKPVIIDVVLLLKFFLRKKFQFAKIYIEIVYLYLFEIFNMRLCKR